MEERTITPPPEARFAPFHYLTLALSLVAILLFSYFIFTYYRAPSEPPIVTPTPAITPTGSCQFQATHSVSEAKDYVARIMASYSDLLYAEVPTPQFNPCDGIWTAQVTMLRNGITQRVLLRVNDTINGTAVLYLDKAYLEGPRPPFISDNLVLTNGTLKLYGKTSCSQNKTEIWEFSDPYCPPCILGEDKLEEFKRSHNDTDFEYHILLSRSLAMENNYGKLDVERLSNYFLCTQQQHLLSPFKDCAMATYRAKGVEAPLSQNETDACLPASLNTTQFETCLVSAPADIAFDRSLAQTYSIADTPSILIDCQYRVHPTYLEHAFCYLHPNSTGCPSNSS